MPSKRRKYQRPAGKRPYRKLFIVATEGDKTEPQYFAILNDHHSFIHVVCIKSKHHSSPLQVLKRMQDRLKQENLKNSDEAWLVVDKDQWQDEQLAQLHAWSQDADNYRGSLWIPGSCLERVIPPAYLGAVSSFFLPSNLALHNGQYPKSHR